LVNTGTLAYYEGGVLAPNGEVHFVPFLTPVGQKISASGVVSTYSLAYTTTEAYAGGVIAPNGDIHFVPYDARVGQKVSIDGVVSTYSLAYTRNNAYAGGVLAPNGEIHFVPFWAARDDLGVGIGQKISLNGVASTYPVTPISMGANQGPYSFGVLDFDGNIHFIPVGQNGVSQKIYTLSKPLDSEIALGSFLNKL
jgi:hypothetical protein